MKMQQTNLAHDDGAINGKFEIRQCLPDSGYHPLHSVNFLPQENIHGRKSSHFL